ncbi:hypothetical protein HK104_002495 [Borealophlyctis nickersoniae]|nr:hypothetical protein HK104_002495 [Borealophlyctis nickersoniae]
MKFATSLAVILAVGSSTASAYRLVDNWSGKSFFDQFSFFTDADPTNGYVDYVDRNTAQKEGLISTSGSTVFLRTDTKNIAKGRGRKSVRLESKKSYKQGTLIVADIQHMPVGCGTCPAFWTFGPDWPNSGEIDILEGVNTMSKNAMTLHTKAGGGCNMAGIKRDQKGLATSQICDLNAPGQLADAGCSVEDPSTSSYGTAFNKNGGGTYATLWDASGIRIWFWPASAVPTDVRKNNPSPARWGRPTATFPFGSHCPASLFQSQNIIINLTFCGDWAGGAGVYNGQFNCPGTCVDFVRSNPTAFKEAYWAFRSIKTYAQSSSK